MKKHAPESWKPFFIRAGLSLSALFLTMGTLNHFYRIGFDPQQGATSTPYHWFLVHKKDHDVSRGEFVSFRTDTRHDPWFHDMEMVKRVVGVPGDTVTFDGTAVYVNAQLVGKLNPRIVGRVTAKLPDYQFAWSNQPVVIPPGKWLGINESFESFDGRYWGFVDQAQVVGVVTPIL